MVEKLILGTVQLGLDYGINNAVGRPTQEAANNLLADAYQCGIRVLDTAEAYGQSQDVIGRYHRQSAVQPFAVITKYKSSHSTASAAGFEQNFYNNLELLNVPTLQAYLFHHFEGYQTFAHWAVLERMKEKGFVSQLGVSVYTNEEAITVADDPRIEIVQLPFNLLDNHHQRGEVLARLRETGKEVHVRSVFLQGLFYKNRETLGKLEPLKADLEKLDDIAAAHQLSIGALAMAYNLRHPFVDKVLIGVETEAQLNANIQLAEEASKVEESALQAVDQLQVQCRSLLNPSNWL